MFKKVAKFSALALAASMLVACGQRVEVPPAHVGKIMTKDGYQDNLIPTSKLRLPACWVNCDRMVILDIADKAYQEDLSIFIPSDQLNLGVTVKATLSINPKKTTELFNSISPKELESYLSIIENGRIYQTYASQIIQKEVREYLSQFSISQIASSNEKINAELSVRLQEIISERTPFSVRFVGITGLAYPKIITDAQEAAAQRREQIQQEEAQAKVTEVKLEAQLKEARLQRAIEKEKAETEALAQRVLADSVDSRSMQVRELEIRRMMAEAQLLAAKNWDGKQPQSITILGATDGKNNIPLLMTKPMN